jgi:hypothetical protein
MLNLTAPILLEAVRGDGIDRSQWAGTISEIRGLSQILPDCKFLHVNRDANRVAHQLAKRAQERQEWMMLRHDVPPDIRSLAQADSAGSSSCNEQVNH